jgi:hypothetical protein
MAIALEGRLRKLEKTVEARMNQERSDVEHQELTKALERLRSTPEGRAAVRAKGQRQCRAMLAEEHARIEAFTPPARLVELRRQWAKEDAQSKALEEKYLGQAGVAAEDLESFLLKLIGKE